MFTRGILLFYLTISWISSFSQGLDSTRLSALGGVKETRPAQKLPYFSFKNGIGIATPDSSYSVNIRFRMQNRALMQTVSDDDLSPASFEARVRRCRLSFAGHMYNKKWSYYLQLSFSKGDMDWGMKDISDVNNSPNVVRDAIVYYTPNKNIQLGLGQTKLPGNRQRVVSSGALQFYDRSIANANFTLDRDFGFFGNYSIHPSEDFKMILKTAITSGEGRNSTTSNYGLAYTGRLEILPLGEFTDGGDYFEGDVIREEKPKISIGVGYHLNDMAVRTQGQLGKDLYSPKSIEEFIADFLFKYKGLAISAEYLRRDVNNPFTRSSTGLTNYVITGDGFNNQISYCFKNRYEIAARYTLVTPHHDLISKIRQQEQYGIGLTKYIMKHKVKVQGNIFYNHERDLFKQVDHNNYFFAVFQIELGI